MESLTPNQLKKLIMVLISAAEIWRSPRLGGRYEIQKIPLPNDQKVHQQVVFG